MINIKELAKKLNLDELYVSILANRGYSKEQIKNLFYAPQRLLSDYTSIKNISEAIDKLRVYTSSVNSEIDIYGDYDVDGLTSVFIMYDSLIDISKGDVNLYYPDRSEGYGIHMDYCKELVKKNVNSSKNILVITVDNGISKVDEIAYLKENGIEVLVIDHHNAKETLPNCIIVNPTAFGEKQHYFSGACVAFNVIRAFDNRYNLNIDTDKYLPHVALSLVADMMEMSIENQVYVRVGIDMMEDNSVYKIFKDYINKNINAKIISFNIAPVINATSRMQHINEAAKLLFETDEDEMIEHFNNMQNIYNDSKTIKIEAGHFIADLKETDDEIVFIDAKDYPKGLQSIIATQGLKRFNKPCVVYSSNLVTDGLTHASCRSFDHIPLPHIFEIEKSSGNIEDFGGHNAAGGLSFNPNNISDIIKSVNKTIRAIDIPEDTGEVVFEKDIVFRDLNKNLYEIVHYFAYDHNTFKEPVFRIPKGTLVNCKRSKNNNNNICLSVKHNNITKDFWWWGGGKYFTPEEHIGKEINIYGNVDYELFKRVITLSITHVDAV